MTRTRRPLADLAVAALVLLVLAGCASGPAGPSTGAASTTTVRDRAMKFAACMRHNGVTDFPDPDASGELTADGVANGSAVDTSSGAYAKATRACQDLQPPGYTGRKRSMQVQKVALAFAQCIRDHGVKDFPDPADGEPLVDTNRIPSTNQKGGMSILNAAMRACGKIYAGQLGLKGP